MAEVLRLICDRCGSEEEVEPYRLSTPSTGLSREVAFDLCPECAAPLIAFEAMGRTVSRSKSRPPAPPRRQHGEAIRAKIYTQEELDEIEEEEETEE